MCMKFTCTIPDITPGNRQIGNLIMLNRYSETKVICGSSTLSSLRNTYVPKVTNDIYKNMYQNEA